MLRPKTASLKHPTRDPCNSNVSHAVCFINILQFQRKNTSVTVVNAAVSSWVSFCLLITVFVFRRFSRIEKHTNVPSHVSSLMNGKKKHAKNKEKAKNWPLNLTMDTRWNTIKKQTRESSNLSCVEQKNDFANLAFTPQNHSDQQLSWPHVPDYAGVSVSFLGEWATCSCETCMQRDSLHLCFLLFTFESSRVVVFSETSWKTCKITFDCNNITVKLMTGFHGRAS